MKGQKNYTAFFSTRNRKHNLSHALMENVFGSHKVNELGIVFSNTKKDH